MAAAHVTTRSILSSFLPRLATATPSSTSRFTTLYSRQLSIPFIPTLALGIPSAISLNIPEILEGIWEGILKAVPKKKTSHSKKRMRQMAGKGLKDVTALNRCSACGHVKRAHLLCPYCVNEIRNKFFGNKGTAEERKAIRQTAIALKSKSVRQTTLKTESSKPTDE